MGFFYNNNLDFTGDKFNNPYALIQKAGKRRTRSMRRRLRKTRRNVLKKTRKYRKHLF
jgi:hypothetical protein